jgi:hypothetical protein
MACYRVNFTFTFTFIFALDVETSSQGEFLGFHSGVVKDSSLMPYGATPLGDWYPTFRDNVLMSSSTVEKPKKN